MNITLPSKDNYLGIIDSLIKSQSPKTSLEKFENQYITTLKEFYQNLIVEIESIKNEELEKANHSKLKYLEALARNRLDFLKPFFPKLETKNDLKQVQKKLTESSNQIDDLIEKYLHLVKNHSLFTNETLPFDEGKSHIIEHQIISEYIRLVQYEKEAPEATRKKIIEKISDCMERKMFYENKLLQGQNPVGIEFEKFIIVDENGHQKSKLRERKNPFEHSAKYGIFIHAIKVDFLTNKIEKKSNLKGKSKSEKKISTANWALFYYYQQKADLIDWFENMEGGKLAGINKICAENESLGNVKHFQLIYNKVTKSVNRLHSTNIDNIKNAITLLVDYPKAKVIAEKELKDIENTKHAKIGKH